MPKVSVVIPVYNVRDYVSYCIDCVVSQTLTDIEIILVDDGSTDGSGDICDKYASADNRIIVIHKQNEGLSSARNDGIEASRSPFVMFIDSDDWVEPNFCELPYNMAEKEKADVVLFTFNRIFDNTNAIRADVDLKTGRLSEEEAMYFNTCVAKS